MDETTYFNKSNVRVTNLQISTKKDSVLISDISAVQLIAPASRRFFLVLGAVFCAWFAASHSEHTGVMLLGFFFALGLPVTAFVGRNVVVTTQGGNKVEVASGLLGEMRELKNAVSNAMTARHAT